jgi:protoporphyrinogen oxidase
MPAPTLVVVGAGVTGLAAAYMAALEGRSVTVLEGAPTAGGLLATFPVGGTRLENFYHHFFTHDAEFHWLVHELGIESRLRYFPASMGIYRNGRLHPFNGAADLLAFTPIGFVAKGRFAASSMYLAKVADWRKWEGVPCLEWFRAYAGKAATDAIWRPMLDIKFGPYADRVPAAWMVGRLRQRLNSRKHGGERLGYLHGSLSMLLERLLARLDQLGVRVLTHHPVIGLIGGSGRATGVRTPHGDFPADDILATVPADRLAGIVADFDATYAESLRRVEHFGAVCTILEMDRPLGPCYWLNVADPGFPFGGVIEHTRLLPPEEYDGRHLVYLSRYFERGHPLATMPTTEIGSLMTSALGTIYPQLRPDHILASYVFRTGTAAVVCDLNFSTKVPSMKTPIAGLTYGGMVHVYPDERSCNNSIRVAAEALMALGCNTDRVPRGSSLSGHVGGPLAASHALARSR